MNNFIKKIKTGKGEKVHGTPFCKVTLPLSLCVDPVTQDVVVVLNRRALKSGKALVFSPKGEFKYETPNGREKCDISGVAFTENLVYFTVRGDGLVEVVLICTRDGDIVTKLYIGVMNPLVTGISVDTEGNIYMCEAMRNLIVMKPQDTQDGIHMIGEGILVAPKQVKAIRNEIIVLDSYQNRMSLILFNSLKECIKKMDFKITLYYRDFDVDRSGNFVMCTTERVEKWNWNGKMETIAIKNRKKIGDISAVAVARNRRVFFTHRRTEDKSDGILVSRSK